MENGTRLPGCKIFEEMNKLGLNIKSSKRKRDWIMDRLDFSFNIHEGNKNKKQ